MALNDRSDQVVRAFVRSDLPENSNLTDDFSKYLTGELDLIQQVLSEANDGAPQVAEAAPSSLRKGMIRYAVSPWDPLGTGYSGYVVYNGTAWKKLFVAGSLSASEVSYTPTGTIASTDVQAAINELDSETQTSLAGKVPTSRTISTTSGVTGGGDLTADRTLSLDIHNLTNKASPVGGDEVAIWDSAASANKKATLTSILALVPTAGAWTQKAAVATTSGTSVTIQAAGSIPSTAKQIAILVKGISTNTANTAPILIFTNGGGDIAAGYNVRSGVDANAALTPTNHITLGSAEADAAIDAADTVHASILLTRVDTAVYMVQGQWYSTQYTNVTGNLCGWLDFSAAGALTGLKVSTNGGVATFDAGSVYVAYFD